MKDAHGLGMYMRAFCSAIASAALACIIGCAPQPTGGRIQTAGNPEQPLTPEGKRIKADPIGYLRSLSERCDALDQYSLTFYRQERVGSVVQKLSPMEQVDALFRKKPFSVKFTWKSPDPVYYESLYVEGQNDSKLILRERKGMFPFPPQVRAIDPALPGKLGMARNPITDFGLARAVRRTLVAFDDPALAGVMSIRYEGLVNLEPTNRPAHWLHVERPPMPGYAYTQQDFYVDEQSQLPAGTDLWLKSGDLGARYRYADINPNVRLSDKDFRLSQGHPDKLKGRSAPRSSPAASQ
jgi:hypothetical protein